MKTDITVSKKATINTGNYSSITPSVSLTLKDVDVDIIEEVHENLNIITAALFMSEFEIMAELQEDVKNLGITEFFSQLGKNEMEADLKEAVKNLSQNLFEV